MSEGTARTNRFIGVAIAAVALSMVVAEPAVARGAGDVVVGSEVTLPEGMTLERLVDGGARPVAVGHLDDGQPVVAVLDPSGAVDRSRGDDGLIRLDIPAEAVDVSATGELTIGFSFACRPRFASVIRVARLDASGRPDQGFGASGVVDLAGREPHLTSIVGFASTAENIYVLGSMGCPRQGVLLALTPTGATDRTFGFAGGITVPGAPVARRVDDSRIIVRTDVEGLSNHALDLGFRTDGVLDRTYGWAGLTTVPMVIAPAGLVGRDVKPVHVLADGSTIRNVDGGAARITRSGEWDRSFGTCGVAGTGPVVVSSTGAVLAQERDRIVRLAAATTTTATRRPAQRSRITTVGSDGGVTTIGGACHAGSLLGSRLNAPIVGIAATASGLGYWFTDADGTVFAFGDARHHGGLVPSTPLAGPIVGIEATPSGSGYWLVARDGGVFAFGDARFTGSAALMTTAPIVGMASTVTGRGYWLVAASGEVFAFGDAPALGRSSGHWIAEIVATESGRGYWLITAPHAYTLPFGDAPHRDSGCSRLVARSSDNSLVSVCAAFSRTGLGTVVQTTNPVAMAVTFT